jgi:hypothetical protein
MGHSVDEVALRVNMYVEDCSLGTADGSCLAICANPTRERAVGGNCISDLAFAFTGYGVTDALGNMVAWECTDRTHDFGPVLRAQVNCLKVGGP